MPVGSPKRSMSRRFAVTVMVGVFQLLSMRPLNRTRLLCSSAVTNALKRPRLLRGVRSASSIRSAQASKSSRLRLSKLAIALVQDIFDRDAVAGHLANGRYEAACQLRFSRELGL